MGKILGEEIKLVLFDLLGVHWGEGDGLRERESGG
jgi:hypothetical protein